MEATADEALDQLGHRNLLKDDELIIVTAKTASRPLSRAVSV